MDGLDKPVHEALLDYDLLNAFSVQENNVVNLATAKPWRMNLCATSEQDPCTFFVATGQYVQVYKIDHFSAAFREPVRTLATPIPRQGQDLGMDTINQIKVGRIFEKEVVVTVSDAGDIWIWRTDALHEPPMTINNDGSSTWGLAIHGDQGFIAVSANSWTINVYNIGEMTKSDPIFGKRRRTVVPVMDGVTKRELGGHTDNIPCIDFNRSGRYIASGSIDQTCRLWDLKTGQQATIRKIEMTRRENEAWCWSVKFISQKDIMVARCTDKQISDAIMRRIHNSRSTALSAVGMRNSAALPIYRLNMAGFEGIHAFMQPFESDNDEDDIAEEDEDNDNNQRRRPSDAIDIPDEVRVPAAQLQQLELGNESLQALRNRVQDFRQLLASGPFEEENDDDVDDEYEYDDDEQRQNDEEEEEEQDDDIYQGPDENITAAWRQGAEQSGLPENQDLMDWLSDEEDTADEPFLRRLPGGHRLLAPEEHRALEEQMVAERAETFPFRLRNVPTEVIPISQSGWSDTESDTSSNNSEPDTVMEADEPSGPWIKSMIPQVMRCSSPVSPSMESFLDNKIKKRSDELIMLTTPKDVILLHPTMTRMVTERWERNVISNVDVRSDRLLTAMDRLNMVEWIPELELYVAASQKGTVALMRVIKVELENGQSTLVFNSEKYLPDSGLRNSPLYGMTVQKAEHDRMTSPTYLIYLFYNDGCVLGYRISRKTDELFAEPIIL
ncbi:hypothetical protein BDB00DRAFT_873470 [Zychaea mexicana]|uniref:uncharacterized protein n=1 Tax=Zychaea mexicana TaxID=64656 RepID=UPI0022FE677F|nr:uncharacterized protein BDB00DRAFT_873470 [Zychaea mexicana]KAI9492389.1 hypothetical protein BDB00DRAFT_873470 [Zychaea mexicana]